MECTRCFITRVCVHKHEHVTKICVHDYIFFNVLFLYVVLYVKLVCDILFPYCCIGRNGGGRKRKENEDGGGREECEWKGTKWYEREERENGRRKREREW